LLYCYQLKANKLVLE